MQKESKHLNRILNQKNRTASVQIVFVDIVKYSKRRTQLQVAVIDRFTECVRMALDATAKQYIDYIQQNEVNFYADTIKVPTGDGVALGFSFDGLHRVHLDFSLNLLREVVAQGEKENCDKFAIDGWCNCHSIFGIRIGISDGKAVIYKDLNGSYNVAGNVINMAARIMAMGDAGTVLFTQEAYKQLIDMVDDPTLVDRFAGYCGIKIKHGEKIDVYQFLGETGAGVNPNISKDLELHIRGQNVIDGLAGIIPLMSKIDDRQGAVEMMEVYAGALSRALSASDVVQKKIGKIEPGD